MHPARIAELLQPFLSPVSNPCHSEPGRRPGEACPERSRREPVVLSPSQLNSISTYIDLLLHWNARINLTAIRNEEEIVTRHFGESLFAATHLFPKVYPVNPVPSVVKGVGVEVPEAQSPKPEARLANHRFPFYPVSSSVSSVSSVVRGFDSAFELANDQRPTTNDRVADIGSGAGFPGIPIKLWAPNISVTLIESSHKKSTFLKEVVRALTLTDINIQNARAETLPPATFDVVTLRAVERPTEILPVAAALLARNGRLALLISSSQLEKTIQTLPNLSWAPPIPIPQSQSRVLLIGTQEPRK
jgi:16S rRNA (guanine(527)-N(7))-methyltransferase RsmG